MSIIYRVELLSSFSTFCNFFLIFARGDKRKSQFTFAFLERGPEKKFNPAFSPTHRLILLKVTRQRALTQMKAGHVCTVFLFFPPCNRKYPKTVARLARTHQPEITLQFSLSQSANHIYSLFLLHHHLRTKQKKKKETTKNLSKNKTPTPQREDTTRTIAHETAK